MIKLSYRSYCYFVFPSLKWRLVSLSFSLSPSTPTRPGCRRWGRRAGAQRRTESSKRENGLKRPPRPPISFKNLLY